MESIIKWVVWLAIDTIKGISHAGLVLWMGLPQHMNDHPLAIIFCKMHVIDAPGCNEFHAGCVIEHFIDDNLFGCIWGKLAVFVIGLGMFNESRKRHRAFCGFLVMHEETTLRHVGMNAPLYPCGVCFVD